LEGGGRLRRRDSGLLQQQHPRIVRLRRRQTRQHGLRRAVPKAMRQLCTRRSSYPENPHPLQTARRLRVGLRGAPSAVLALGSGGAVTPHERLYRGGQRFESPQLHQTISAKPKLFWPFPSTARNYVHVLSRTAAARFLNVVVARGTARGVAPLWAGQRFTLRGPLP
jgi:hypothetical protein